MKSDKAAMKDMDAHADLRTLIEAAKIRADKGRHGAAMKKRDEHMAALKNIGQPTDGAPIPAGNPGMPTAPMPDQGSGGAQ